MEWLDGFNDESRPKMLKLHFSAKHEWIEHASSVVYNEAMCCITEICVVKIPECLSSSKRWCKCSWLSSSILSLWTSQLWQLQDRHEVKAEINKKKLALHDLRPECTEKARWDLTSGELLLESCAPNESRFSLADRRSQRSRSELRSSKVFDAQTCIQQMRIYCRSLELACIELHFTLQLIALHYFPGWLQLPCRALLAV